MEEDPPRDEMLVELARQLREQFQDIMQEPIPQQLEELLTQLEETARSEENNSQ